MEDKDGISIKKLITKSRKTHVSNLLRDRTTIGFYIPGTKIEHLNHFGNKVKLDNYFIEWSTFGIDDKYPYHTIKKYALDDESLLTSYKFECISESILLPVKYTIKSVVEISNKKYDDITDEDFLWIGSIVALPVNYDIKEYSRHMITSISLDYDLNIVYYLDRNLSRSYTRKEFFTIVGEEYKIVEFYLEEK